MDFKIPDLPVLIWPDIDDLKKVKFLILLGEWKANLQEFSNLRALLSFGAGVDYILVIPNILKNISIVRLEDSILKKGMIEYVLLFVLRLRRLFWEGLW